jgi:hypothetical protein
MKETVKLLENVNLFGYLFAAVIFSLAIRAVLSCLKALSIKKLGKLKLFGPRFTACFYGNRGKQWADYWYPFWIGCFELVSFPLFMQLEKWNFIGAWIALKTLPQWKVWIDGRTAFNRYLIGNALILLFSFGMAVCFFD